MTRGGRIASGVIAAIVAVYVAAAGYLAANETRLVYPSYGRPSTRALPTDQTTPWDTVRVRASDSTPVLLLVSRLNDAQNRPWAIFLHGNRGTLGSRGNVARYQLLRDANFNVIAPEYRGYGAMVAVGKPTEPGVIADATAAWSYLTDTLRIPPNRIVIYGWSLGGGPAVALAVEKKPAALVTEGAFTSLPAVGAERYPWIPARLIMRNRFDNLARAPAVTVPWIIYHGRPDSDVPFAMAAALAAAAPNAAVFALDADHDTGVLADRANVVKQLSFVVRQTQR